MLSLAVAKSYATTQRKGPSIRLQEVALRGHRDSASTTRTCRCTSLTRTSSTAPATRRSSRPAAAIGPPSPWPHGARARIAPGRGPTARDERRVAGDAEGHDGTVSHRWANDGRRSHRQVQWLTHRPTRFDQMGAEGKPCDPSPMAFKPALMLGAKAPETSRDVFLKSWKAPSALTKANRLAGNRAQPVSPRLINNINRTR